MDVPNAVKERLEKLKQMYHPCGDTWTGVCLHNHETWQVHGAEQMPWLQVLETVAKSRQERNN